MAAYITKIRTAEGDKQIDYNALANLPDLSNLEVNGSIPITSTPDENTTVWIDPNDNSGGTGTFAPMYFYETVDIEEGSPLATGVLYIVYEDGGTTE